MNLRIMKIMNKGLWIAIISSLIIIGGGLLFAEGEPSSLDKQGLKYVLSDESELKKVIAEKEAGSTIIDETQALYRVPIELFEEDTASQWQPGMPSDQGFIKSRRIAGAPKVLTYAGDTQIDPKLKQIPKYRLDTGGYESKYPDSQITGENASTSEKDAFLDKHQHVLGVRVDFHHRGHSWFAVYPPRPIRIYGMVKGFEVWVCGRNYRHSLHLIVNNLYGQETLIKMGDLNFLGWKKLFVTVPDTIVQSDYRISTERGLTFKGFLVKCHPMDAYGKYYIYFDNLYAEVSRFWEEYRDDRDPVDNW